MKRISGLWLAQDAQGYDYISVTLPTRRARVYLAREKKLPDSPDASLWLKQADGAYARATGLWFRETRGGKSYMLLELQEGNFRVFVNERKTVGEQPDYVLYQLTDSQGKPVGVEVAEVQARMDEQVTLSAQEMLAECAIAF